MSQNPGQADWSSNLLNMAWQPTRLQAAYQRRSSLLEDWQPTKTGTAVCQRAGSLPEDWQPTKTGVAAYQRAGMVAYQAGWRRGTLWW